MPPRVLITLTLSVLLGAALGYWLQLAPLEEQKVEQPAWRARPAVATQELSPALPHFTSDREAREWVEARAQSGLGEEVEALFRPEAGLSESLRLELAQKLVREYRRMDPQVLGRILLRLPPGKEEDRALNELFWKWAMDDAEECLRFLETLPPERLNSLVLHNAGPGLSLLPAERLIAFARRLDDRGRAFLAEGVAASADQCGSWANTSAALARMEFKPDQNAVQAEWQFAVRLARIAPDEIERRIAAEPDPRKRDNWLDGYSWNLRLRDPEAGLRLRQRIENADLREDKHGYLDSWLRSDRDAALTWLLSDAARAMMSEKRRRNYLFSYGLEEAR